MSARCTHADLLHRWAGGAPLQRARSSEHVRALVRASPRADASVGFSLAAPYTAALNGHVKVLGEPSKFIGMEITRNRKAKTLTITQTKYIEKLAEKFSIGNNYKRHSMKKNTQQDLSPTNSKRSAEGN